MGDPDQLVPVAAGCLGNRAVGVRSALHLLAGLQGGHHEGKPSVTCTVELRYGL